MKKALILILLSSFASLSFAFNSPKKFKVAGDNQLGLVGDDEENQCVYTIYVRTSNTIKGGTDSKISTLLAGSDGWGIKIDDLVSWGGLMGPEHNYYERGNLDIFSGRGPCLNTAPCWMNLTSDGTGSGHGWYCNYVEVTYTGPHAGCSQKYFEVEAWLATDRGEGKLYAVRDVCSSSASSLEREKKASSKLGRRGGAKVVINSAEQVM